MVKKNFEELRKFVKILIGINISIVIILLVLVMVVRF